MVLAQGQKDKKANTHTSQLTEQFGVGANTIREKKLLVSRPGKARG